MQQWKILGYLGLLPFIVCLYLSGEKEFWGISGIQAFISYSAIILSFIAGTLWKTDTQTDDNNNYIISNIFSLIAFVSLLVQQGLALIILGLSFLILFVYEKSLGKQKSLPTHYIRMRFCLTLIVVLLHITAYTLFFDLSATYF